jgi:hypothetical protein
VGAAVVVVVIGGGIVVAPVLGVVAVAAVAVVVLAGVVVRFAVVVVSGAAVDPVSMHMCGLVQSSGSGWPLHVFSAVGWPLHLQMIAHMATTVVSRASMAHRLLRCRTTCLRLVKTLICIFGSGRVLLLFEMWFTCCCVLRAKMMQVEGMDESGHVIMANPPTYEESERRERAANEQANANRHHFPSRATGCRGVSIIRL